MFTELENKKAKPRVLLSVADQQLCGDREGSGEVRALAQKSEVCFSNLLNSGRKKGNFCGKIT